MDGKLRALLTEQIQIQTLMHIEIQIQRKKRKGIVSRIYLQNGYKSFHLHVILFVLFQSLISRTMYFATTEGKAGGSL